MVIHITPIGIETAHVFEGIKEKQFGQPDKLYLLHSPNQKKQPGEKRVAASNQFKKIALDIKNQLEGFVETYLIEINAFDMNSVWDGINKIIKDEFEKDESLTLKDFAINVTGGTNLMAVASTIAAGSRTRSTSWSIAIPGSGARSAIRGRTRTSSSSRTPTSARSGSRSTRT